MENKKPKTKEKPTPNPNKPDAVSSGAPHIQFNTDTSADNPENFDEGDYEDVNDKIPEREEEENKGS